jgi:hypothetical protein
MLVTGWLRKKAILLVNSYIPIVMMNCGDKISESFIPILWDEPTEVYLVGRLGREKTTPLVRIFQAPYQQDAVGRNKAEPSAGG